MRAGARLLSGALLAGSILAAPAARAQAPTREPGARVTAVDSAAFARGYAVVPLRGGPSAVDLLGDGGRGVVLVARTDNGNGHGWSTVTFAVRPRVRGPGANPWQAVAFGAAQAREPFRTAEGADCTLGDARLLRPNAGGAATLVVAERDFGRSYADSAAVHFSVYRLVHDADPDTYQFVRARTLTARRSYCDVNAAFAQELGLDEHAGAVHEPP